MAYKINDFCIECGTCAENCPDGAIEPGDGKYVINPAKCIDCGTCSYSCPVGAAQPED